MKLPEPIDLSSIVRAAIRHEIAALPVAFGFFVQPRVMAMTLDPDALADLVRELIAGMVAMPKPSPFPVLVFRAAPDGPPPFYALTLFAAGARPPKPIGPRARAIAESLGACAWDMPPTDGETVVVCFALDESAPAGDALVAGSL